MTPKIIIAAGGTGGHIFPGLAMADYFREQGWEVRWIGTCQGLEAKLVPEHGYAIDLLPFTGLRGKGLSHLWRGCLALLRSFWLAWRIVRRQKPGLILSFGGYPSFPPALAGVLCGRPLIIHEANAVAGLANRALAPLAREIAAAFPEAFAVSRRGWLGRWQQPPHDIGSPVRKNIAEVPPPAKRFTGRSGPLRLLILGGSLGAQSLNTLVIEALRLTPVEKRPLLVHQTGRQHFPEMLAQYQSVKDIFKGESLLPWVDVVPFIEDMAKAYAECDLVICRAGALTIAELTVVGVASILVPLPSALADEQSSNAESLAKEGAAWHLPQRSLSAQGLADFWQSLTRETLVVMAGKARGLGSPYATEELAALCCQVLGISTPSRVSSQGPAL